MLPNAQPIPGPKSQSPSGGTPHLLHKMSVYSTLLLALNTTDESRSILELDNLRILQA